MSSRGTWGRAPCTPPAATEDVPRVRWCAYRVFAATASSVAEARGWVCELLTRANVAAETLDRAELLTSELATNAVWHAGGAQITVWVQVDQDVAAAVRDDAATSPIRRCVEPWEEGGRGLALVAALADEWGSCSADAGQDAGKWVWFRLRREA